MKDFVCLNYAQTLQTEITARDIDNTIPAAAMNELLKDDLTPYFSVEAIKYPVIGNTHIWGVNGVYEEGYFDSLAEALKTRTIPGSKDGHSDSSKPANDIFVTGMKMVKNGDGSGTAYFKIYIPPKGFITDNAGLIRDAKLGLLRFSLVSKPQYDQQKLQSMNEYHIIGTRGGDRNDAVEEGAMSQTVNGKQDIDIGLMRDLVNNGQITQENSDGKMILNGKVSRPALRQYVSRADVENKAEISELISLIDKSTNGGKTVDMNEATGFITNALANNSANVNDIAKKIGLGDKLRNSEDEKNAETVKALNALNLGEKPLDKIQAIIAENTANADAIVKNKIVAVYGVDSKDVDGKKTENTAYAYAYGKCKGLNGKELDDAMNALAADPVMKAIRGNQADPFMQKIETLNGEATNEPKTINGIQVINIGGK